MSSIARQAIKNTPKRLPSVSVRSPLCSSPPTMESQPDSLVPTPPMDTASAASEDPSTHSVVRTLQRLREGCQKELFCSFCYFTITLCHLVIGGWGQFLLLSLTVCLSGPGRWGVPACDRSSSTRTQRWRPGCISRRFPTEEALSPKGHTTALPPPVRITEKRQPHLSQPPLGESFFSPGDKTLRKHIHKTGSTDRSLLNLINVLIR